MQYKKIAFQDCLKKTAKDLDKAKTPEETVDHFYEQVTKLDIKIMSEVKRIDTGRLDIPVYFSVYDDDARAITGSKKAMGKGSSIAQAKASACMELVERFSFFSFTKNSQNFLFGTYQDMEKKGYNVLEQKYLLQSVGDYTTSPEDFAQVISKVAMQWTWATNISQDSAVLIPFSWFYAINEYNGSSSGNTIEEAALQGICEVVERDVCSRVSHKKESGAKIDPESISDPIAKELLNKFGKEGVDIYLNDITLDSGIATISAVAIDKNSFPEKSEIVFTAGTAPNPEKALIRTLTEVAQLAGDFETSSNYLASGLFKPQSLDEVNYLTENKKVISISEITDFTDDNIKKELEYSIAVLSQRSMDILMIDITHKDLQIPALYTIIPGAQFRERSQKNDAGLFAAKMLAEQSDTGIELEKDLQRIKEVLGEKYYIEYYRGKNYYNIGLIGEANNCLQKSLSLEPLTEDIPYIYSWQGLCLRDLELYDEAIEALKRGLEYDRERADIYNTLGVCYFKQEQYREAIEQFKKAVEINPASAMDYANIGVNYYRLGEIKEARQFLTLAITLEPTLDFALNLLDEIRER